MPNIRTTLATLVAGGVVGIATQASAAVTIQTFNIADSSAPTDIKLASSSTAQFNYGAQPFKDTYLTALGATSGIGAISSTFSLPVLGETYASTSLDTAVKGAGYTPNYSGDEYAHLSFYSGATRYVGVASFDTDATLTTIAYEKFSDLTSAVPEPESWALLLAGFGAMGATLRQRRRQSSAVTA